MPFDHNQSHQWQHIIWREWRNCENTAYAKQLFELVADTRVGWGTKTAYIILDAIIGMVGGLLLAFIWTSEWTILQQFMWAGALVGAAQGVLTVQRLSWRDWLTRLAFGLPTQQPSGGLILLTGLLLLGSIIFGPLLWLLLIGLFWGMSGLIKWMMQGLTSVSPFEYQAWYFWWRGRPPVGEVEAALQRAYEAKKQQPVPLKRKPKSLPGVPLPPPIEIDFPQLRKYARNRQPPLS